MSAPSALTGIPAQRAAVCAEARSWVGTRYHTAGRIKLRRAADGTILDPGGVDCATLLAEVFARAGVIAPVEIGHYSPDWHLHRSEERYLGEIERRAREISEIYARPGDVVIYRFGRAFAHGAIIMPPGWPAIIHSVQEAGSVLLDHGDGGRWGTRPRRFYTCW